MDDEVMRQKVAGKLEELARVIDYLRKVEENLFGVDEIVLSKVANKLKLEVIERRKRIIDATNPFMGGKSWKELPSLQELFPE